MTTTMTVTEMAVAGGSDLGSGDGSLRDTVTGDEKSPPPTDVTACTCEHDTIKCKHDHDTYNIHECKQQSLQRQCIKIAGHIMERTLQVHAYQLNNT